MESANYDLIKLKKHLKRRLDQNRFHHTIGVMYTAAALAMAHGMDFVQAETAGLLHDCAKCIPDTKKIQICERKNISITCCERDHPDLLHSKLGAYLSKTDYGITDQDILDAITWHTTGKPDMRQLAFSDLNECMYQILKDTVHYLKGKSGSMDETTVDAYLYYSNYHNSREE